MAAAVDVNGLAVGVTFGDVGGGEVQVEGTQKVATQAKQWRLGDNRAPMDLR